MANFYAERINVGIDSLPQFQVTISMTDYGRDLNGPPHVIQKCATVEELDYAVNRAITELNKAREIARGILEEN